MANRAYCQTMAKYNQWMNGKIYEVCAGISVEERKQDRKAFFKSVHGTLNHLLWGDRAWMKRLTGGDYPITKMGEDVYADFEELRSQRAKLDAEIVQWAESLTDEWIAGTTVTFESVSYKRTFSLPASICVMQLFNHQTHHRGQLTTLLTQMGVDYGPTDLPVMPG